MAGVLGDGVAPVALAEVVVSWDVGMSPTISRKKIGGAPSNYPGARLFLSLHLADQK